MDKKARIYVAGHLGLTGSAILRRLHSENFSNLITRQRADLDLTRQGDVFTFFKDEAPDYVFLCAARVGGILANNSYPADFIRDNLLIQTNVINAAFESGAKKLMFLSSSCAYPRNAPQPLKEEYVLSGKLEPTNEPYAVAKLAGMAMCQSYRRQYGFNAIVLMPTNLYGPGDNFDLQEAHVIAALLRKFHEAKVSRSKYVEVWGSGTPRREFMQVDDFADAAVFLMKNYDSHEIINVGTGVDVTVSELATLIKEVVGYKGEVRYDASKPDGTPRKLLDVSKLNQLKWHSSIALRDGLAQTYAWYKRQVGVIARPRATAVDDRPVKSDSNRVVGGRPGAH